MERVGLYDGTDLPRPLGLVSVEADLQVGLRDWELTMRDVFIVGGARTPMAEYVGALRDVSALELGAIAARGALQKSGLSPDAVDDVVFGNVLQTSADAHYGARHVALKAGI